eukprot:15642-Heterococcus_DN1.PRE.1
MATLYVKETTWLVLAWWCVSVRLVGRSETLFAFIYTTAASDEAALSASTVPKRRARQRISVLPTSSTMPNKKSSKKARKKEAASVSAAPEPGTATNAEPLLSPELQAELGGADAKCGDISTSIVLPATGKRKRDKTDKPDEETHALATHLSKSKRKKLDQIADRKAKAEKRGDLYKRLEGQQLTAQQLGLMQHSGHLGKKDTLKEDDAAKYAGIQLSTTAVERLRRTVQRAAAGIAPNALEVAELAAHGEAVAE